MRGQQLLHCALQLRIRTRLRLAERTRHLHIHRPRMHLHRLSPKILNPPPRHPHCRAINQRLRSREDDPARRRLPDHLAQLQRAVPLSKVLRRPPHSPRARRPPPHGGKRTQTAATDDTGRTTASRVLPAVSIPSTTRLPTVSSSIPSRFFAPTASPFTLTSRSPGLIEPSIAAGPSEITSRTIRPLPAS